MFLHLSVILFTGDGICPVKVSVLGISVQGGLCPGRLCPEVDLCQRDPLGPEGDLCQGDPLPHTVIVCPTGMHSCAIKCFYNSKSKLPKV